MTKDELSEVIFSKLCDFFRAVLEESSTDKQIGEMTAYCMMFVAAESIYKTEGKEPGEAFIQKMLETIKNAGTYEKDRGSPDAG